MRTKEAEELEVQERTWIYLLHDQTPPTATRNVTPAVLAARSSGVLGDAGGAHMPLLPTLIQTTAINGPAASAQTPRSSMYSAPATTFQGVDAFGRPLVNSSAYQAAYNAGFASSQRAISSVMTANDKWRMAPSAMPMPAPLQHQPYLPYQHHVPQQQPSQPPLAPLRSMLSKNNDKAPVYHTVVVPGPMVMKSEQPSTPATAKSAFVGLLPKKRRHDEMVAPFRSSESSITTTDDADEDDESRLAKRNCFPKKCDFPMCKNSSRSRGFCYSHGGGRRCRMDGCNNGAVSRDLCKRHGGGRRCRISGCKSSSESGGLCYSHGGGRRCSLSWCSARAKKGGYCAVHIDNKNAAQPSPEELEALNRAHAQSEAAETKAAVPPTVVETLLSLSQAKASTSSGADELASKSATSSSGAVSPSSPTLPELSTPRFSSIASLLN